MLQSGRSPTLESVFCGCFGAQWGWGSVEGPQSWAAAVCQYGSSSAVSTAMAPVVLSSRSWAMLFQLFRPRLPTSSGCKPEPPVL